MDPVVAGSASASLDFAALRLAAGRARSFGAASAEESGSTTMAEPIRSAKQAVPSPAFEKRWITGLIPSFARLVCPRVVGGLRQTIPEPQFCFRAMAHIVA